MSITFFSERLRLARKEMGLTLTQLGERIGMTQGGLSHLENGTRAPTRPIVTALAQALGIREEWLLEGEEPIYAEQNLVNVDEDIRIAELHVDKIIESSGIEVTPNERSRLIKEYLSKLIAIQQDLKAGLRNNKKGNASYTKAKTVINANISEMKGDLIGHDKIITQRHTTRTINTPPLGSISEAQARQIHNHLVRIGELESDRLGKNAFGIVMNQFKDKFEIPSYKNLESKRFDEAALYLQKRIKTLESSLLKTGKEPISRDEYVRRIQTICKRELKWTDPIRRKEMLEYTGKASLKEFTIRELENFYNYVKGKKARKKQ